MTPYPDPSVSRTVLLGAAIVLERIHGRQYAFYFLAEHGFDELVIEELFAEPTSRSSS